MLNQVIFSTLQKNVFLIKLWGRPYMTSLKLLTPYNCHEILDPLSLKERDVIYERPLCRASITLTEVFTPNLTA
jgi:hypothetical protein